MLLNTIYTYPILTRKQTEFGRFYSTGTGNLLPSVTTILSASHDTAHLDEWRARIGAEEADRITAQSATIGTHLHSNLENYINGVNVMAGPVLVKMMTKSIIANGLKHVSEVWGTETPLYYPELYAGTADVVAVHKGEPAIIDFKNSIMAKKEEWISGYQAQLAAYAMAHNVLFGTNIQKGVVMMASRDGKYSEFVFAGKKFKECEQLWLSKLEEYYLKTM